jgi:DNA-binding Lrp family transcriptional regulator
VTKSTVVSAKLPEEVHKEFALRIAEGERSAFIRDAIIEKLQQVPRPDKLSELEERVGKLEAELSGIKNHLAKLELLTYEAGNINPHTFGIDETDHQIIDYLLHYKGATTTEIAEHLHTNRWLILNRLRKLKRESKKELGKPMVQYHAGKKRGKRKAWWLNEDLVET